MRSSFVHGPLLVALGLAVACGSEVADLEGPTPGPTPGAIPTGAVRPVLENEYVVVNEVVVPAGQSLDRGQREDRLILARSPVVLEAYEGADRELIDLEGGEARWWQAVVERLTNRTDRDARFLEIVRLPRDLPPIPAVPPERRLADAAGAALLIDERDVRRDLEVVRLELASGGASGPFWTLPAVLVVEQGSIAVEPAAATTVARRLSAGDVAWLDSGSYSVRSDGAAARLVIAGFAR